MFKTEDIDLTNPEWDGRKLTGLAYLMIRKNDIPINELVDLLQIRESSIRNKISRGCFQFGELVKIANVCGYDFGLIDRRTSEVVELISFSDFFSDSPDVLRADMERRESRMAKIDAEYKALVERKKKLEKEIDILKEELHVKD